MTPCVPYEFFILLNAPFATFSHPRHTLFAALYSCVFAFSFPPLSTTFAGMVTAARDSAMREEHCGLPPPHIDCAMFEARFQTFEDHAERAASAARVAALRAELKRRGLTGFIVPRADRHQNEYVPPSEERLAWLTGFTGSAGAAIVLADRAVLFVDGRYMLQVRDRSTRALFAVEHLVENPPDKWLETNLTAGARFGYDPWLHTVDTAEKLAKACAAAGATLVPAEPNPIDAVWADRPAPPLGRVDVHDLKFAGERRQAKLARIHAEIVKLKADALVVSDPHDVAWTFNIRGADVAHTPLPLSFAIVPQRGPPVDLRRRPQALQRSARPPRSACRRARAGAISCAI